MRTDDPGTYEDDSHDALVSDSDLIGFYRPRDIVEDPILSVARKRQLLAFWASDVHAVIGAPSLRSYAFGPAVSIDDIKAALVALDDMIDIPAMAAGQTSTVSP